MPSASDYRLTPEQRIKKDLLVEWCKQHGQSFLLLLREKRAAWALRSTARADIHTVGAAIDRWFDEVEEA